MIYVVLLLAVANGWCAFWTPRDDAQAISRSWRFARFLNGFTSGWAASAVIASVLK